jgi:hypothetical protein
VAVAVAVGLIALAGVAAETGVVMLTYVDSARGVAQPPQRRRTTVHGDDDRAAIRAGAVDCVRPKMPRRAEPAENLSARDRNITSASTSIAPRDGLFLHVRYYEKYLSHF